MAPIQVSASSSARSGAAYGGGGLNEGTWITGSTGSGSSGTQTAFAAALGALAVFLALRWAKKS